MHNVFISIISLIQKEVIEYKIENLKTTRNVLRDCIKRIHDKIKEIIEQSGCKLEF